MPEMLNRINQLTFRIKLFYYLKRFLEAQTKFSQYNAQKPFINGFLDNFAIVLQCKNPTNLKKILTSENAPDLARNASLLKELRKYRK
jgi:hypothetical protein